MDTQTLITDVLLYQENLESALTGDFVKARNRVKRNAQRIVNWVHLQRPWRWKITTAPLVITSGEAAIPAAFASVGRFGGLYPDVGLPPLRWVPLNQINELRQRSPNNGPARVYSIGPNSAGVTKFLFYPTGSLAGTVKYEQQAPRLADLAVGDSGPDFLSLIPLDYHDSVIYEGTVWYQMKDKANSQSVTEQKAIFMSGFKAMVEIERPGIEAAHNVVPYGTGRR